MKVPWLIRTSKGIFVRRATPDSNHNYPLLRIDKPNKPVPEWLVELDNTPNSSGALNPIVAYWCGICIREDGEVSTQKMGVLETKAIACRVHASGLVFSTETELFCYADRCPPRQLPISMSSITSCPDYETVIGVAFNIDKAFDVLQTKSGKLVRLDIWWIPGTATIKVLGSVYSNQSPGGIVDIDNNYLLVHNNEGKYNVCENVGSRLLILAEDVHYDTGLRYGKRAI